MPRGFVSACFGVLVVSLTLTACDTARIPVHYGTAGTEPAYIYVVADGFYFIVDTGTQRSYVTADLCRHLNWLRKPGPRVAVGLGGRATVFNETVDRPQLSIQGMTLAWDEAWVLTDGSMPEAEPLDPVPGLRWGGLLGLDALRESTLSFDSGGVSLSSSRLEVGMQLSQENRGTVSVDGNQVFVIDTGFSGQLVGLKPTNDPYPVTSYPVVFTPWLGRVFPGTAEGSSPLTYLAKLSLAGSELFDLTLATINAPIVEGTDLPPRRLLLGLALLREAQAVADFKNHRLLLRTPGRLQRTDIDRLAIKLSRQGSAWRIMAILPSHPSYAQGLRVGDSVPLSLPADATEFDAILALNEFAR